MIGATKGHTAFRDSYCFSAVHRWCFQYKRIVLAQRGLLVVHMCVRTCGAMRLPH